MSSQRNREDLLAGAWPAVTPPSRDDIRDEIEDHLACRAAELTAAGVSAAQAEQRARAAFGDVEAVARQLYWLHHGRRIMAQRIMLGGLAGVCALLAIVLFLTYRQSAATAGAVAELQATVGAGVPTDVLVNLVLSGADGRPLAGRDVYVWSRRVDGPPFLLPDRGLLAQVPPRLEVQYGVTLPPAYELLVTDEAGAAQLGRRPPGAYTVAVDLEPELVADGWAKAGARRRAQLEQPVAVESWAGVAQQVFEVHAGREPVTIALRLPTLARATVPLQAPSKDQADWKRKTLWVVVCGTGDGMGAWLRASVNTPEFVDGVSRVSLPLPEHARLHIGYSCWRASPQTGNPRAGATVGMVLEADASATASGERPAVTLEAPPLPQGRPTAPPTTTSATTQP